MCCPGQNEEMRQQRMEQEVQEKRQAEFNEKMRATENAGKSAAPSYGIAGVAASDGYGANSIHNSTRNVFQRRLNSASDDVTKYARIVAILDRHPEFEELFELLRLTAPHLSL